MGYVEQNLLQGEEVVYRARLNFIIFLVPALCALLGLLRHHHRHGDGGTKELFPVIAKPLEFRTQFKSAPFSNAVDAWG